MTTEDILSSLKANIELNNSSAIVDNLKRLVSQSNEITLTSHDTFEKLLNSENMEIKVLSLEAIAELAKTEKNRTCLTNQNIVNLLLALLQCCDEKIKLQTCRALGNICFENDNAHTMIKADGIKSLIKLISDYVNSKSTQLVSTSCGCLMNILMGSEELQKASYEHKVLEVIEVNLQNMMPNFDTNEDSIIHNLTIINMVIEHMNDDWLTNSLCLIIIDILNVSVNPEISTLCLEILRVQCENDDVKLCLAKRGTCELIYDLVEKHGDHVDDDESRFVLKLACDLIVLILTGDESMEMLYNFGNGKVYQQMIFWLNSEDIDLLSTGVLAIGNFARNDLHCIQMVENGLAKKLLGILKYYSAEEATKVQHALLSTLRNLSIPTENKSKLLDENLVDTLLSMLNINHSSVEFKLLGTLRMVVDGQEKTASELICRKDFVEKLVYWCYNSDHLGVRGEAPRLLAWLIKNCNSLSSYSTVLSIDNTVKCLVDMMSSMHPVMQNEAILALNLLCAKCLNDKSVSLSKLFVEAKVAESINFIINKDHIEIAEETIENLVTLVLQLTGDTEALLYLKENDIGVPFKKMMSNPYNSKLIEKLAKVSSVFES